MPKFRVSITKDASVTFIATVAGDSIEEVESRIHKTGLECPDDTEWDMLPPEVYDNVEDFEITLLANQPMAPPDLFFGSKASSQDLRLEAREIDIGAPDGRGYAQLLRELADRLEEMEILDNRGQPTDKTGTANFIEQNEDHYGSN